MIFNDFINFLIINNNSQDVVNSLTAFGIAIVSLYILQAFISKRLENYFEKKNAKNISEKLEKIFDTLGFTFYLALPIYIALLYITLPEYINNFIEPFFLLIFLYYAVKIGGIIIHLGAQIIIMKEEKDKGKNNLDPALVIFFAHLIAISLWAVALLLFISNLGYDVTTLIAGLGIGGIAIAFALQGILSDLFASFSIYLDKPFKKGEFIMVDDDLGTVEKVGIKSTRINSLRGELLVISNKELTDARIHNFTQMSTRRVVSKIGIVYDTDLAKTKKAKELIKKVVENIENVKFDRVHFKEFGDFSLNFELVYYILSPDYNTYMDLQEEINLNIKKEFEKAKIEFAYPTQTVYIKK